MAHKPPNDSSAYKRKLKLDLHKIKNGQIQSAKIDLTKINTKTLATQLDLLSNDINSFMILQPSNKHHALNDRTLNLLKKGNIDTNAIIGGPDEPTFSDAEISELLEQENK